MSERILKALMQLFAIIADPENDTVDRRSVVENFLQQQLNTELVKLYMDLFDGFLESNQEKQVKRSKKKVYSSNSVRVLKLCTEINQELTKKQKIVLIIRLLEFIRTDSGEVTENEIDFVNTVASTFNIIDHEYNNLRSFIIKHTIEDISGNEILLIDDNRYNDADNRIYTESLRGQIRILNIASVGSYIMRYLGDDELYLNGQLLNHGRSYIINVGSSLRNSKIKPIYYSDIVSVFNTNDSGVGIDFEVHHITHRFSNGKIGIHDISFSEEEGKLVGIMGVSGSGKTTLLSVLNGSEKPAEGHVLINGKDIHSKNDEINGLIGYVSQDDLLIEELTVFQNLYYNAKLCFGNYSERRIIRSVLLMLHSLGLYEIKDIMVGSPLIKRISGGQRKRLNIALELIREPAVLFLDEPTSGLSSRDSENILDLLKELTLRGKLVFVVIHQPSSDIFKMFDKLLLLDTGGHLIYNGDPVDSIVYFKSRVKQADWNESECHACGNVNPEQLFNIVESRVIDEYGNFTRTRKTSPLEWAKFFKQFVGDQHGDEKQYGSLPKISFNIPNGLKQFFVFTIRDVLSKLANKQYLALNLLLSPILAIALSFIIKYYQEGEDYEFIDNSNLPVYIFMSVIVALFIGLTVSAEEIIKDRKIRKREKFLNLSRNSYLLSKVFILIGISALQSFLFVVLGNSIIEIKGMYLEYWLMLFTVWISANLVGLNVSDTFKTTVNIYILIPFLIIPQIILSGVLVQFDKLNPIISRPGTIPWYGEFITARWA
ncbi:MAG TPA: ABC transporter, partial [Bacteroidales bacterium]|nr:ABC transporter [Bacteroidales bacterium]